MNENDGIALTSIAHPTPKGCRRVVSFVRLLIAHIRMWLGCNLETVEIEIPDRPGGKERSRHD